MRLPFWVITHMVLALQEMQRNTLYFRVIELVRNFAQDLTQAHKNENANEDQNVNCMYDKMRIVLVSQFISEPMMQYPIYLVHDEQNDHDPKNKFTHRACP